mgnify:CR=1 FL=1
MDETLELLWSSPEPEEEYGIIIPEEEPYEYPEDEEYEYDLDGPDYWD